MSKYVRVKVPETKRQFQKWSLGFTVNVLRLITAVWGVCMAFAAAAIALALYRTGELSYLDTFINRVCDCFMAAVVTGLITRVIGNVFEYNDGGIFGKSRKEKEDDGTDSNDPVDDLLGDDELNHRRG